MVSFAQAEQTRLCRDDEERWEALSNTTSENFRIMRWDIDYVTKSTAIINSEAE